MKNSPKVTVIVPTHNHAHFLPDCLSSIKAQTYDDYEVIVVNNGSTDDTEEVVRRLAWDKLKYHYQKDTGSVAGPRNTGIRLASGEFAAFLDSDDSWHERKLEKVMAVLEENKGIDIISHPLVFMRQGKKNKIITVGPLEKDMFASLLIDNRLLGSATVVRRSVIAGVGGFDPRKEFVHVEDYDAWLNIASQGKKFYFLKEPLGTYRVHASNLSSDFKTVLLNEKNVVDKHFKNFKGRRLRKLFLYRDRICLIYSKMGIQYFFRKKYLDSFVYISKALFLNPLNFFKNIFKLLFL